MSKNRKRLPKGTAIGIVVAFSKKQTYLEKKNCIIKVFYNALTNQSFKRREIKI